MKNTARQPLERKWNGSIDKSGKFHSVSWLKISGLVQEMPKLHTADQPMAPRGRATKHSPSQDIRKTFKAKHPT